MRNKLNKKIYDRARYLRLKDRILKATDSYRRLNPEVARKACRKWRSVNKEKQAAACKEWNNLNKEKKRIGIKKWHILNPHKNRQYHTLREVAKMKACPSWRNDFFISEIYELARRRTRLLGIQFTVDHIVPLRSKLVCGLHVENNLRIISRSDNSSKGNRSWKDMP